MPALLPRALLVFALVLAACSTPGTGGGGGDDPTSPPDDGDPPPASVDAGGGGGGGGGASGDLDAVADRPTPPNATETGRFSTGDALVVTYDSGDSVDSIRGHYERAIPDAGLNVVGTSSVEGVHTWIFGNEDGTGTSGGVTVAEGTDGGSTVSISLGATP